MIKQIAILSAFCTIGCASERQLQKAETKLAQSGRLPKICADRFPSRDSIVYRDSVRIDTAFEGEYIFDTIRTLDTIYITKTVPVIKTIVKWKTAFRERTDKIEAIGLQLEACNQDFSQMALTMVENQKELDRYKRDAKTYFWWLWIVIVLSIGWTFRKFIFRYVIR
jgi:hypothetical protein